MKKKVASEKAVKEALENLYKDTPIERAMEITLRNMCEKHSRGMLSTFLLSRLNQDFLRVNTHVPVLAKSNEGSNEDAVKAWADQKLDQHPEQLRELTSEFMIDTYRELQEILIENEYL